MPKRITRKPLWPLIRDTILLAGGLVIVVHQTIFSSIDRPSLLAVAAAMMGLPFAFRKDEQKDESAKDKSHEGEGSQ